MPDADNTTPEPIIKPSEAEQSYERVKGALGAVELTGATMRGVSAPAVATRAGQDTQVDWERDRLALRVLLGQRWDAIRKPARFHLDHTGQSARVALYGDIAGMRG